MTKTSATAATGMIHSADSPAQQRFRFAAAVAIAYALLPRVLHPHLRAIEERQDFGHRGVQLGGNGLADFDAAIQRLRQRRILDDGNFVPASAPA